MPLFGKKKDKSAEKAKENQSVASAPQQFTQPPPAYPGQQQMMAGGYPGAPQGPPPPYAPQTASGMAPGYAAAHQGYPQGYQQGYPQGYPQGQPYQPAQPQPPMTYVVQGGFDSGARFDGAARPNIPPPPPGCMPNMAQAAMQQGHNVVVSQQKQDFLTGGTGGGYVMF